MKVYFDTGKVMDSSGKLGQYVSTVMSQIAEAGF